MAPLSSGCRRVQRSFRQSIDATPAVVFPLLCPQREVEWLEGFAFDWVYSASGFAEPGAVFTTSAAGEPDTVWITSRHDAAACVVQFVRVTEGSRTCLLTIAVSAHGDAASHVDISYEYTSLGSAGDAFLGRWTEQSFVDAMTFWENSMNYFLKTGKQLKRNINT